MPAVSAPRTLAEQLRGWTDDQLSHLLSARPDLSVPVPRNCAELASRASTRASATRAVDELTLPELVVLEAAVASSGPVSSADLCRQVNASSPSVGAAVESLMSLALLWGDPHALRPVSVLREVAGTSISRLGPLAQSLLAGYPPARLTRLAHYIGLTPRSERDADVAAVARHLTACDHVATLLEEVSGPARALLDHLDREGSVGASATAQPSPVDELLSRGLLLARDPKRVAIPREVGLCLRGGRSTRDPVDVRPPLPTSTVDQARVDSAAGGAAFDVVRRIQVLLEHWAAEPPAALRGGGLSVRDLKAAADLLQLDVATTTLHIEVGASAGLLGVGTTEDSDASWLPTDGFDAWVDRDTAVRWARLASAWLDGPRLVGLAGSRDEAGKPMRPLGGGLERAWAAETRRTTLQQMADLPPGTVLASPARAAAAGRPTSEAGRKGLDGTTASLVDLMCWLRPRRPPLRAQAISWATREAAALGVTGLGGMSSHGRELLSTRAATLERRVAAALTPLLPEPIEHILLQGDLTAVAPGPLTSDVASRLAAMADIESRGGATVYRFTERSLRRAFDLGWSAQEVSGFLSAAATTTVPAALTYLVGDVARKFGTVRVGTADSFLRSDDEAALASLLCDPKASGLNLRRIAPTVVLSDAPVDVLLARLRELGAAPVVEAADGSITVPRARRHRAPALPGLPGPPAGEVDAGRVSATVAAVRAGERAAASRPTKGHRAAARGPLATMALLREAAAGGETVWMEYVDNSGSTFETVVEPLSVDDGRLMARDHRSDSVRAFALHRISRVQPMSSEG